MIILELSGKSKLNRVAFDEDVSENCRSHFLDRIDFIRCSR
jgi:hypothetical protein